MIGLCLGVAFITGAVGFGVGVRARHLVPQAPGILGAVFGIAGYVAAQTIITLLVWLTLGFILWILFVRIWPTIHIAVANFATASGLLVQRRRRPNLERSVRRIVRQHDRRVDVLRSLKLRSQDARRLSENLLNRYVDDLEKLFDEC